MAVEESSPRETASGHAWFCNACPFQTVELAAARSHAREFRGGAYGHILYERKPEDVGRRRRPRRRVHAYTSTGLSAVERPYG